MGGAGRLDGTGRLKHRFQTFSKKTTLLFCFCQQKTKSKSSRIGRLLKLYPSSLIRPIRPREKKGINQVVYTLCFFY